MAEYSNNAVQIVNPGESVIFTEAPVPCTRGLVKHRDDTGNFLLKGYVPQNYNVCPCCRANSANYLVGFGANISIPTGGTAGEEVSLALVLDGDTIPSSTMAETIAATGDLANVSCLVSAEVWKGCCETLSVRNTSSQPIQVQNANIVISRPDLVVSR